MMRYVEWKLRKVRIRTERRKEESDLCEDHLGSLLGQQRQVTRLNAADFAAFKVVVGGLPEHTHELAFGTFCELQQRELQAIRERRVEALARRESAEAALLRRAGSPTSDAEAHRGPRAPSAVQELTSKRGTLSYAEKLAEW